MALTDEVQNRVSGQLLRELTNHGDTSTTSINTTRLGYACTGITALFEQRVGVPLDVTVAAHVDAAVMGVLWLLHTYTGENDQAVEAKRKVWEGQADALSRTLGSRRPVQPDTTSVYAPTSERSGDRPATDPSNWSTYTIGRTGNGNLFDQPDDNT